MIAKPVSFLRLTCVENMYSLCMHLNIKRICQGAGSEQNLETEDFVIVSWLENKKEREIKRYYSSRVLPHLPVNAAFLIALFFWKKKKIEKKKERNSQSTPEWRVLFVTTNRSFRRLCLLNSCVCRVRKFPSPNCNSTTSCLSSKHRSRVKISAPLFEKTFRNSNTLETKSRERIRMWESFWYFVRDAKERVGGKNERYAGGHECFANT